MWLAALGAVVGFMGYRQQQNAQEQQARLAEQAAAEQRAQAAESRRMALAEQEANKRRADIQNMRTVRAAVRESRLMAGTRTNLAAGYGTLGSSGYTGGTAAQTSTMAGNLTLFGQQLAASQEYEQARTSYAMSNIASAERMSDINLFSSRAAADAASGAQMMGLGEKIFTAGGGFTTIFGGNKGQQSSATPMRA